MPIEVGSFSIGIVTGGVVVQVINHFLTKDRDLSKVFNERSEDLFISISKHAEGTGSGIHVDDKTRLLITPYISRRKRRGFQKAVENYNSAQNCNDGVYDPVTGGGLTINERKVEHYRSCAEKLLCYLKRR